MGGHKKKVYHVSKLYHNKIKKINRYLKKKYTFHMTDENNRAKTTMVDNMESMKPGEKDETLTKEEVIDAVNLDPTISKKKLKRLAKKEKWNQEKRRRKE